MKYKVSQKVKVREDHRDNITRFVVGGSMDNRYYLFLTSNVLVIKNAVTDKKYGVIYNIELPEGMECWIKEDAIRSLKSKKKEVKVLNEIEYLDKIALNFREG